MRDYAERKAARIERKLARAERLRQEGNALLDRGHKMASVIPFGQPILVGHHSEGRDRNYRARIDRTFTKGVQSLKEAERAERQAISSDDPEAVRLLREKLEKLEKFRADMIAVNTMIRKVSRLPVEQRADALGEALKAAGYNFQPSKVADLLTPDFAGRVGFAKYQITNSAAEVRRLKGRIEELTRKAATPEREPEKVGDVRIEESENRVRIYFTGKPAEAVRTDLKRSGFRWSPSEGAWQSYVSEWAWQNARRIAQQVTNEGKPQS
jgi:hypothetical protein